MRKVRFSDGEFYHLYNRGVDKRVIFTQPAEYDRFLAYLFLLNSVQNIRPTDVLFEKSHDELFALDKGAPLVSLGAFCLMPNHFHLYVSPLVEKGISKFMQRLQTAYTMYFNEKHSRDGALFQGTFKAQHADRDAYAKYLFSYIHLNPAKLLDKEWKGRGRRDLFQLRSHLIEYPYSSLGEYLSGRYVITNPSHFPEYLTNMHDINEHIDTWLQFRDHLEREA